jgi:hypothetical protein
VLLQNNGRRVLLGQKDICRLIDNNFILMQMFLVGASKIEADADVRENYVTGTSHTRDFLFYL